ncbi:ABC transporter ATP-binding protein [Kroppenstedtia pulmonis]|uniref:ABC transporter ATP-binding protein n=1 Tax=Kroppenstedtia pulmonis TaxID=1380685 RepID=A0A7D3XGS5_9BACL|nr:ABC transporter ATP-binding protein [Kroppenstedtia pulmonis]QKG83024.1 ABC transporter ATP-binding protein [Kroppenstedtia pulmonis]
MTAVTFRKVNFWYPGAHEPSLEDLSFQIATGTFILLCGPSGCGKTTLLKLLKPELRPSGKMAGSIHFQGIPMDNVPAHQTAKEIGMVFQHPEHQIVLEDSLRELVFGMENLNFPMDLMRRRAAETSGLLGLENMLSKPTESLSGGEKQLLNLASVLALNPRLLLLDEPTTRLDPVRARQFLHQIKRWNEETGMTVILTEHRLDEAFTLVDRILVLNRGRLDFDGPPQEAVHRMKNAEPRIRSLVPAIPALALKTGKVTNTVPLTVKEGRQWLEKQVPPFHPVSPSTYPKQKGSPSHRPLLSLQRVNFSYRDSHTVLKQVNFQLHPKECVAFFGGNGSGKTTLLQVLAGLLPPDSGSVRYRGKKLKKRNRPAIGYLPQNVESYFFHDTVAKELEASLSHSSKTDQKRLVWEMASRFGLVPLLSHHPHDLSGGEMQKTALASLFLQKPEILLLDEPTQGLDPEAKQTLSQLLHGFIQQGRAVVFTTHDPEFAAVTATGCVLLFQGEVAASDRVPSFFKENDFYTTAVYRMTRDTPLSGAVTLEEAIRTWNGQK